MCLLTWVSGWWAQADRLVRSAACPAVSLTFQVLCLDLITLITPSPCCRAPQDLMLVTEKQRCEVSVRNTSLHSQACLQSFPSYKVSGHHS